MGSGFRTFTAGEVLTASNVQNFLQNQSVMVFADSTARATDIGTANFEEGMVSYLENTDQLEVYNGTAWASIAPASTQGLTLLQSVTFSAVASQSITSVFSSNYRFYRIVIDATGSSAITLQLKFRVASDTSTGYYFSGNQISGVPTNTNFASANVNQINFMDVTSAAPSSMVLDLFNPNIASRTNFAGIGFISDGTNLSSRTLAGMQQDSTQFTGYTLLASSGTITGTVNTYGYNN
jgi:hypothetical protein